MVDKPGHILESKGSIRYYSKSAHLELLFQKKKKKNNQILVLNKKGIFFINTSKGTVDGN